MLFLIKGQFNFGGNTARHGDDNYVATGYGQTKPASCAGALIFGSGTKLVKVGGEYGGNGLTNKNFSFNTSFGSTNSIIFENHQECASNSEESAAVVLNNFYIR